MNRIKKLEPVIEIAQRETETALKKLGEMNAVLAQAESQLEELLQYRDEYLHNARRDGTLLNSARQALDVRAFLRQLEQAIQDQQDQVTKCQQFVAQQRQNWLEVRNKEHAMISLQQRYISEEQSKQLRREQRASDEHTNNSWWHRNKH